ncbi:d-amino acid oxidase [Colletotrichum karsti]|uniref:D-amino acid oxidase n=1 Tax=Colletotrichum karsti TaxID=1095194 RepID=A0A9P6IGN2_9PEZI|nr:d-amino acid oxidase [Colletotrichum karsti]KAF9878470.1 d-amino acid oxidase [Colletotrichum karsti]
MDALPKKYIVIVGAGIIGLNTALALCRRGLGDRIVIFAEHLPGDTSINYASPWAGANFSAVSGSDSNALRWDRLGYLHLMQLAKDRGRESFVQPTPSIEYWDEAVSTEKIDSMSQYLQDFRTIPKDDLPTGVAVGVTFTTLTVNAPKHLEWLSNYLKTDFGVRIVKKKVSNIDEAFSDGVSLVFNCTGNASKDLGGVEDASCYPTRGQIAIARVPHVKTNMMRHGKDYVTYIIPRPWSNGNVVLGGFMQKGVSTGDTFSHETDSILQRTASLSPEIQGGPAPDILAVAAGLRPSRKGGARVEKTEVTVRGKTRYLVHNYGAGGTGYQAGYVFHSLQTFVSKNLELIMKFSSNALLATMAAQASALVQLEARFSDTMVDVGDLDLFKATWEAIYAEPGNARAITTDRAIGAQNHECRPTSDTKETVSVQLKMTGAWGQTPGLSNNEMREGLVTTMYEVLEEVANKNAYQVFSDCEGFSMIPSFPHDPNAACGPYTSSGNNCDYPCKGEPGIQCTTRKWAHRVPSFMRVTAYIDNQLQPDDLVVEFSSSNVNNEKGGCGWVGPVASALAGFIPVAGEYFATGIEIGCSN